MGRISIINIPYKGNIDVSKLLIVADTYIYMYALYHIPKLAPDMGR